MPRGAKGMGAAGRDPVAAAEGKLSRPAPGPCNGTALRKATRRVSQLYDVVLAPCGLRSTQRSILAQIERENAPTMSDLAAALVLDLSALGHNLKPLERDGLVTILVDRADKRSRRVTLTKRGIARLEESTSLWQEAQARFEVAFGAEESVALRRSLALIASEEFTAAFHTR